MTSRIYASFGATENTAAVVEELLASTENIRSIMDRLRETAAALDRNIGEFRA